MSKLGGHLIVEALEKAKIDKVFCVPGESYLSVLDGLYNHENIELISTRHEGGAAFMAEAYAKASGKVGVCMATRGVGAANLSIGLHTAMQDSTPVVAFLGQVERDYIGKEAFQEVDLAAFFGHICKWTVEIQDAKRIPEIVNRAFHMATSGRPGPVVVSLPHDMLEDIVQNPQDQYHNTQPTTPEANKKHINEVLQKITKAKKPIIIAGGGVTASDSTPLLVEVAEKLALPVATAFRRFDAFPNEHPSYAGWLGFGSNKDLLDYIYDADLVIAIGTRFSQVTTQDYSLLKPGVDLIHIDISQEIIGKVYTASLAIVSDVHSFLQNLNESISIDQTNSNRMKLVNQLHSSYMAFSTPQKAYSEEYVDLDGMLHDFVSHTPKNAIITSDAGNFFGWLSKYYRFEQPKTYIGPTSGAMGYGLPAALGAKLAHPNQPVISFSGDGGFMMTMQELATSIHYNIPVIAIVVNNNLYGTIRAHQEKHFPDRVVGTELSNPNFSKLAEIFGCNGERVTKNDEFIPALQRAIASNKTTLIEVLSNPDILSVNQAKVQQTNA
ncbi:thiamine pyrophosphate-dependent enzyme [Bacillus massiliigorillae]|uniref:thiamine pyrophosphate-dependent enzyme n=1 Tax=Bacillus massiliigorillae TaxID=1243664 RepID=UPI0003A4FD62|nr:thiamine pyrophosphate-dependent enzyme [Bacillus massiliigorillae]